MEEYTRKGQRYIPRQVADRDGARWGSWWRTHLQEVEERYGQGTRMYFTFSKILVFYNACIALISLVAWCSYLYDLGRPFRAEDFFVGFYPEPSLWRWTNIALVVFWFAIGPLYYAYERWWCSSGPDLLVAGRGVARPQTNVPLWWGYTLSTLLTLICLAIGSGILYGLAVAQEHVYEMYGRNTALANFVTLVVSIGFVLIVQVWDVLAYHVTELEHNRTWFAFRMSLSFKLIGFKIVLATMLYLIISFVVTPPEAAPLVATQYGCTAVTNSGVQFLILVVGDLVANFVAQVVAPLVTCSQPEFNIAENLLVLSYRQFLLYMGVLMFPLLAALVVVIGTIQYWVDRIRLLRICRETHFIPERPGFFLLLFLWLIAVAALLSYPNGALWILMAPASLPSSFQNCTIAGI